MAGFLKSTPVTDDQRRENDRHRTRVVLAVLAVLAVYIYLFTFTADYFGLPRPVDIANSVGFAPEPMFDEYGYIDPNVEIQFSSRYPSSEQDMLIFYAILVVTFLAFYYAPLGGKQPILVAGALLALALLYGVRDTAGLLFAHTLAHAMFHPRRRLVGMLLPGLFAAIAFTSRAAGLPTQLGLLLAVPVVGALVYRFAVLPLLDRPKIAARLRVATAHSALIAIVIFALVERSTGTEYGVQMGILLFFWQWSRLIMYQLDYSDGLVPIDTPLVRYLAVFFSPGAIPSWDWGVELGLGYSYCNNSFLCEDKNKTVMSGVKILWVALLYLVLGETIHAWAAGGIEALGVNLYETYIVEMVAHFMRGGEVSAASVLLTSLMDTLRWTVWFVGIVHFKTGVWRICGYRFAPYFNRPWLATNLVVFWARYTYYYREFLLQAFYYPVFLRIFRSRPQLRIVVATFAAAGAGNMIWGHLTERMYYYGLTSEQLRYTLRTWPYYVLLGGGIAFTALYLLKFSRRKKRKAWTPGPKLAVDVIAVYCTFQYFALIHIMSRPAEGSTEWDLLRLMLRAFGVEW